MKFKLGFTNLIAVAIGTAIGAVVIASVAIPILAGVNTTGWASTDTTIFNTVKTFLLVSLMVGAIAGTGLYMYNR